MPKTTSAPSPSVVPLAGRPPGASRPSSSRPTPLATAVATDRERVVVIVGSASDAGAQAAATFVRAGFLVVGIDDATVVPSTLRTQAAKGRYVHVPSKRHGPGHDVAFGDAAGRGDIEHVVCMTPRGYTRVLPPTVADFASDVDDLLVAGFAVARLAVEQMKAGGGDRSLTFTTTPSTPAGAGIAALVRSLAATHQGSGLRINAVALEGAFAPDPKSVATTCVTMALALTGVTGQVVAVE